MCWDCPWPTGTYSHPTHEPSFSLIGFRFFVCPHFPLNHVLIQLLVNHAPDASVPKCWAAGAESILSPFQKHRVSTDLLSWISGHEPPGIFH